MTGPSITELMEKHRWCYWLDRSRKSDEPGTYPVSVVIENHSGHYPTGGGDKDPLKAPWYWNRETCRQANAERGISESDAFDIVCSSMFKKD